MKNNLKTSLAGILFTSTILIAINNFTFKDRCINSDEYKINADRVTQQYLQTKYQDPLIRIEDGEVVCSKDLVTLPGKIKPKCEEDIHCSCLAYNIYHEARSESVEGQVAVAQVTMNRVFSERWANNPCDVVRAHKQFSWTLKKGSDKWHIKDKKAWKLANTIAYNTIHNNYKYKMRSLHYHTKKVNPKWNKKMTVEAIIGNHIFLMED
jgi:hypothetical protein